jgi:hypothetical protein
MLWNLAAFIMHIYFLAHVVAVKLQVRESWRVLLTVKKDQPQIHVASANPAQT